MLWADKEKKKVGGKRRSSEAVSSFLKFLRVISFWDTKTDDAGNGKVEKEEVGAIKKREKEEEEEKAAECAART